MNRLKSPLRLPSARALLVVLVAVLVMAIGPASVFADPPAPASPGSEVCTLCHWDEISQWRDSPHAANDVTCEECHGAYEPNHPNEANMKLSDSPEQCRSCHEVNYDQWHNSLHANANVTCLSCHTPHNQSTRLQAQELCISCHDDDIGQSWELTSHAKAGVTCADCHLAIYNKGNAENVASQHGFVKVPSQVCATCHAENLHEPAIIQNGKITMIGGRLASYSEQENLNSKIDALEKNNHSLQNWVLIMLGIGLGVGMLIGVIAMLIFLYMNKAREVS